jgi:hypothetical protein
MRLGEAAKAREWVRAGHKAGEPTVFEAEGPIESRRRGSRVAHRESFGVGAVALCGNAKGEHTIYRTALAAGDARRPTPDARRPTPVSAAAEN